MTVLSRNLRVEARSLGLGAIETKQMCWFADVCCRIRHGFPWYYLPLFFFFYPGFAAGRVCEKRQEILFPFCHIQGPTCGKTVEFEA